MFHAKIGQPAARVIARSCNLAGCYSVASSIVLQTATPRLPAFQTANGMLALPRRASILARGLRSSRECRQALDRWKCACI
ncbi:MAG: hypothetical protein B7Z55_03740 [Planctomycetales bacterium 12-60-4]|nr:MAG: hypothetical protein B7Z55_03740 [Planctomycetales bacterium 12-60-4]